MVGISGKRRFFFADTVPEGAGVTNIAFRFRVVPLMILLNMFSNGLSTIPSSTSSGAGAVAAGVGPRRIRLVNLVCSRANSLSILTAVATGILGFSRLNVVRQPIILLCSIKHSRKSALCNYLSNAQTLW